MKGYFFLNSASNAVAFSVSMLTYATSLAFLLRRLDDLRVSRAARARRREQD